MQELVWSACTRIYMAYVHVLAVCTSVCTSMHACACGNQMLMLPLSHDCSLVFETGLSLSRELSDSAPLAGQQAPESPTIFSSPVYTMPGSHMDTESWNSGLRTLPTGPSPSPSINILKGQPKKTSPKLVFAQRKEAPYLEQNVLCLRKSLGSFPVCMCSKWFYPVP